MQEIEIFFDSKTKLTWKLRDHDVAKKWFMCLLRTMIESQYFQPRFSGFEKNSKTESKLIAQLRKIREIINQTGEFHIKESIPDILDRDMLNILHHYFEEFFYNPRFNYHIKNQNTHITGPILSLNHNVHDLEFLLKNQKNIDSF
ncbi:MAG: hypothetical protein OEY33_01900, partial [Bdellovibrionales bacterium]|nr:hypothetical protein [Bdellovibrionales bacterium]